MAYIGKQEPEGRERNRGAKRRWTIPAPPGLSPCGLEARQILEEVPGPLGVELWQRFRDAVVWNAVAAEGRHHLFLKTTYLRYPAFAHAAAEAPEIHPALRAFGELVSSARAVDARALTKASTSISEWATLHGHEETAALYAGLAADGLESFTGALVALAFPGRTSSARHSFTRTKRRFLHGKPDDPASGTPRAGGHARGRPLEPATACGC